MNIEMTPKSFTDHSLFFLIETHLEKVACFYGASEQKTLIFTIKQIMLRELTWRARGMLELRESTFSHPSWKPLCLCLLI